MVTWQPDCACLDCTQAAQPQGVHLPRTLWEYRKEFPVRASVYFSGLLAAPRLTVFWLLVSEREMVQRVHNAAVARLQIIVGESRGSSVQVYNAFLPVKVLRGLAALACLL